MYKIKILCTELKYNNKKILPYNCDDLIDKLNIPSYGYINQCTFVFKTLDGFTNKILEMACDTKITELQLKRLLKKLHKVGVVGEGKIEFIDALQMETLYKYSFKTQKALQIKEKKTRRNRSQYSTRMMYKKGT